MEDIFKKLGEITKPQTDANTVLAEVLLQKIRERLDALTIEKWWDFGDYEEIRDKDFVANNILEDVMEHFR